MGKPKKDSGTWLMTYGDLVTLLLVFFVLLYTMTPGVEEQAFNSFISFFQQHSGLMPENSSVTNDLQNNVNPEQVDETINEQMEKWVALAEFMEMQEALNTDDITVEATEDGFVITLTDSVAFNSGSAELVPVARELLAEISKAITESDWEVEVQGHTDNIPISNGLLYPSNWHLGAARAVSVVQYLQEVSESIPQRFMATSFGEYRPIADNNTQEGRRQNRRVEIYLRDKKVIDDSIRDEIDVDFVTIQNEILEL